MNTTENENIKSRAHCAVDHEDLEKKENDPPCNSARCNDCSVFISGGCMAAFCDLDY